MFAHATSFYVPVGSIGRVALRSGPCMYMAWGGGGGDRSHPASFVCAAGFLCLSTTSPSCLRISMLHFALGGFAFGGEFVCSLCFASFNFARYFAIFAFVISLHL
jgi:hypothetical protein